MYQPNPVNDFYMRNAAMYQQPPYQQQFNFPPPQPPQPRQPAIHASWVTNIEEAKASRTDDFTATNLFIDTSTGKIYLKRMDNDGRPQFLTYIIDEPVQNVDPLNEINSRLSNIEHIIGGLKHDKSVPGNAITQQSAGVPQPAVTESYAGNDETESAGIPKNAGNGWRKK